jgi:hypothetical protein
MPPKCTICQHKQRPDIDSALVSQASLRDIAGQYGVGKSSLSRHMSCLNGALEKAREEHGINAALDVDAELTQLFAVAHKLKVACDEWLTDPADASRYTLEPRADEVEVIYVEQAPGAEKPVRRRDLLSGLLARIEGKLSVTVTHTVSRQTDNRRLLIEVLRQLVAQLDIVAKLRGLYKQPETNPYDNEQAMSRAAKALVLMRAEVGSPISEEQARDELRRVQESFRKSASPSPRW